MRRFAIAAVALLAATPASAEVVASADNGFIVRHAVEVTASPQEAWDQLIKPAAWWSDKHTFSGDAANLSLDAMAAGCFCEVLPSTVSPRSAPRGSVEHMRVLNADSPRALRMTGALGPLQAEAVQGTLTIVLRPAESGGGTLIMWEYVVGGYMRQKVDQMAPLVDAVLGEQLSRLAAKLGGKAVLKSAPKAEPKPAPAKPDAPPAKPRKPVEGR